MLALMAQLFLYNKKMLACRAQLFYKCWPLWCNFLNNYNKIDFTLKYYIYT